MDFNYKITHEDGYAVLEMRGNLIDRNQAAPMLDEIQTTIDKGVNQFVISMAEYKYLTSTGIGVLVNILTKCRRSGGEATICSLSDKIKELLIITKLNTVFTITDDLSSAIRQIQR